MDNDTNAHAGTVVLGVDGSGSAGHALAWAVDQAVAERRPLTLAHAVSPLRTEWRSPAVANDRLRDALLTEGREVLRVARRTAAARAPELEVREVLRAEDARSLLLDLSTDAALMVLGSRGRGPVLSLFLGSVGVALTRHAHCPVVIHRPTNPGQVRRGVLVGIDGSEDSRRTLEFAFAQASVLGLPLTVLHSSWNPEAAVTGPRRVDVHSSEHEEQRLLMAESIAGMGEKFPEVHVEMELAHGYPGDCVLQAGARMNLIVLGARRGTAASAMVFGSAATTVVEHATCPVAVVP